MIIDLTKLAVIIKNLSLLRRKNHCLVNQLIKSSKLYNQGNILSNGMNELAIFPTELTVLLAADAIPAPFLAILPAELKAPAVFDMPIIPARLDAASAAPPAADAILAPVSVSFLVDSIGLLMKEEGFDGSSG